MSDAVEERVDAGPVQERSVRGDPPRYARAGVVADRDAHRDYITEDLNEALDLLERTAQSPRRI